MILKAILEGFWIGYKAGCVILVTGFNIMFVSRLVYLFVTTNM